MKGRHHFLLLSIFVICMAFLLSYAYKLTGADIVFVDSGGSPNISIGTDFFIVPPPNVSGGTNGTGGTGGTGSGGGGGGIIPTSNISVNPGQFILNMLINTNLHEAVSVTNIGGNSATISISQTNLTNLILIGNTTLTLAAGETKTLDFIFIAPNSTGVYNGTINIGDVYLILLRLISEVKELQEKT